MAPRVRGDAGHRGTRRDVIGVVAGKKPWFGRKRSGIGWSPASWQGWLVIALVVAAIVLVRVFAIRH